MLRKPLPLRLFSNCATTKLSQPSIGPRHPSAHLPEPLHLHPSPLSQIPNPKPLLPPPTPPPTSTLRSTEPNEKNPPHPRHPRPPPLPLHTHQHRPKSSNPTPKPPHPRSQLQHPNLGRRTFTVRSYSGWCVLHAARNRECWIFDCAGLAGEVGARVSGVGDWGC